MGAGGEGNPNRPEKSQNQEKATHSSPYLYKYKKGARKMARKVPLKHAPQIQNGPKRTQMGRK